MATTLTFKSLSGATQVITIGKGNGTLIGAPEPFVVQEDDDVDPFAPIRTTTGYVNFIDNGSVWKTLLPASATDVTVECDGFFGFAVPQTYGGQFMYGYSEYSLAVACPLCAMASFKLSYNDNATSLITFGDLLDLLIADFDQNLGISIVNDMGSGYTDLKVQWALLFDGDPDTGYRVKYNNLEILENICKFFGRTARSVGRTIQLRATDIFYGDSYSVTEFKLADTSSTEELVQGVGLVKITSKVTDASDEFFKLGFDEILEENIKKTGLYAFGAPFAGNGYVVYYLSTVEAQILANVVLPQYYYFADSAFVFSVNNCTFFEMFTESSQAIDDDAYNKAWRPTLRFIKLPDPSSFSLTDFSYSASFANSRQTYFSGGYIEITGRAYHIDNMGGSNGDYAQSTPESQIVAVLRIGDWYYNGSEFEEHVGGIPEGDVIPHFVIKTSEGNFGKMIWRSEWGLPSYFEDKYIIPINGELEGIISFCIGPVLTIDGEDTLLIENISLTYHRDTGYRTKTEQTYTAQGGSFSEDVSIDSIFATDTSRMKYGPELVVGSNGFYGTHEGEENIEQLVADRIATMRNKNRHVLTLNLRYDDPLYNINPPYKIAYGGKQYYSISVSKNTARGAKTVKFFEV